jgi:hypothetical protein
MIYFVTILPYFGYYIWTTLLYVNHHARCHMYTCLNSALLALPVAKTFSDVYKPVARRPL